MENQLCSPLHERHLALEAKMGQEDDYAVPLSYGSGLEEASRTRASAGVFDLSHAGRIRFRGDDALSVLERLCACDVAGQEDQTARPAPILNDRGGIVDDALLLRLEEGWLLMTGPGGRQRVLERAAALAEGRDAGVEDQTARTAQLAVCGPAAAAALDAVLPFAVSDLPPGAAREGSLLIARYTAVRRDLGRLWAIEVILPALFAGKAWGFITGKAGEHAIRPAGLAAWDVLRIEEGLPRYGHEINETIDPATAGLEGALDWDREFIGREALLRRRGRPPARRRVGLVLGGAAATHGAAGAGDVPGGAIAAGGANTIPRQGAAVLDAAGAEIGTVTSGTYSPWLGRAIALAHVAASAAQAGTPVRIALDGGPAEATIAPLPFPAPGE